MARIPLAEIPGVGPIANPVLSEYPNKRVNFEGIAQDLQQNQVSANAFSAPGQALEQAGYAVGNVAGVFGQLADQMQKSQNYADVARAENVMEDARAAHAMEAASLPEDQRVPLWESKYRPQVEKDIAKMNLSPWATDRVMPQWVVFDAKTRTNIAYDAYKSKIANNEQTLINTINKKTEEGDFEGAMSTASTLKDVGYSEAQIEKLHLDIEKKARQQTYVKTLNADPKGMLEQTEIAKKEGRPPDWFPNMQPDEVERFNSAARSQVNRIEVDTQNDIRDAIISGKVASIEDIRKMAGDNLPETKIAALEKSFTTDPAYDAETVSKLRTEIMAVDFKSDKDLAKYNELADRIDTTVPKNIKGPLNSMLYQAWSKAGEGKPPQQKFLSELEKHIDSVADSGLLGDTGRDPNKTSIIKDAAKASALWDRVETGKEQLRKWMQDNPKASPKETMDQVGVIFGNAAADAASKQFKSQPAKKGWFSSLGADMTSANYGMAGVAPTKQPATVRNNNPGAMWYVGGWQKKYGADFGETLNDGLGQGNQIAMFPDAVSGAAAQMHLLSNYGNVTVQDAITKWSGGNDVKSYLSVLGKGGFSESDKLPEILSDPKRATEFVRLMSSHETGGDFPLNKAGWAAAYEKFKEVKGI